MVLDLCLLLAEKKINKSEKKNEKKKKKGYKSFLGHR